MKQLIITLACFLGMLFLATSYSHKEIGIAEGQLAPLADFSTGNDSMQIPDLHGKHVLLSFWTSTDANSRIRNKLYDNYVASFGRDDFAFLGINYDRDRDMFTHISRRDGLDSGKQIYDAAGKQSSIFGAYDLARGYKSVLIDPSGKVVAINPGTEQLRKILESTN